jgi:peptidyl-prolyl cis-trans isomerase C
MKIPVGIFKNAFKTKSSAVLRTTLPLTVCGVALFASLSNARGATELAKINGSIITLEEFNSKYQDNLRFFQLKPPSRKKVLDDLIQRELGVQEAKRQGLDRDPEVINRVNTVLYHALLEKTLAKELDAIHVTIEEAKSRYNQTPTLRSSHIFVAVKPNATPAEERLAFQKITKIQTDSLSKGKLSFSEVAQRYSEGPAAPMGGDLDFQNRNRLDPVFYETALHLGTPGKISGIVRSQFGYHIIQLTAIRPWEKADQAEAKRWVFEEKRAKIFEQFMTRLRNRSEIAIRPELLRD